MLGAVLWFLLCPVPCPLLAQSSTPATAPPAAAGPTFALSVTSRLVVLDVTATDAAGAPVTDLTRDDFRVYEDGVLQPLRSFEAPAAHTLSPAAEASADPKAVFDPASPAAFGKSPVTILLLDQLNTRFEDNSFARRSIRDFLLAQPSLLPQPTELLDLYDEHFTTVSGFTRDRATLLRLLDAEPTRNPWTLNLLGQSENGPIERLEQSLRALETVTQNAARIPGRKNLVWVGGGYPTLDPQTLTSGQRDELHNTMQHVTDDLLQTRTTLYAVDPKTLLPGVAEITDPTQLAVFAAGGDTGAISPSLYDEKEAFDALGPMTGGRVVRGLNDVPHQIALAVEAGTVYYTLGYTPTAASAAAGAFRRVRVVCTRPGVSLTTRTGYYPTPAGEPSSPETMSYDLSTAAGSDTVLTALHIAVTRAGSQTTPPELFDVRVSAADLTWTPIAGGGQTAAVEIMLVWQDAKGRPVAHVLHGMHATAKDSVDMHDPARTADFLFSTESGGAAMPPKVGKAVRLRFIVRDAATGRMGSAGLAAH